MENKSDYIILEQYYQETLKHVGEKNARRYNLKTVNNFIIYFNKIDTENKELVYNELYNYLTFIKGLKPIGTDREAKHETNELYHTFLSPLVNYYNSLGFSHYLNWKALIYMMLFPLPILLLLNCSLIWYIIVYSIFFILRLRSWFKEREHKAYGPLY